MKVQNLNLHFNSYFKSPSKRLDKFTISRYIIVVLIFA